MSKQASGAHMDLMTVKREQPCLESFHWRTAEGRFTHVHRTRSEDGSRYGCCRRIISTQCFARMTSLGTATGHLADANVRQQRRHHGEDGTKSPNKPKMSPKKNFLIDVAFALPLRLTVSSYRNKIPTCNTAALCDETAPPLTCSLKRGR